jgi:hypothetical protein
VSGVEGAEGDDYDDGEAGVVERAAGIGRWASYLGAVGLGMYVLVSLAVFGIAVLITYYRYREHFSDLAFATDSKRSGFFWTMVAVAYAIILVFLWGVFYLH